mmetsp:Transcript_25706/g.29575  ORF Transcript_25706/g.29575 Transcript_25706/m.29575 type:complete len:483 (-) Transcript_25706:35-1483(-)
MKAIAVACLLVLMFTSVQSSPLVEAEQVIEGILIGAFKAEAVQIRECIQDGEAIFHHFEDAINHFKNKGAAEIVKGLISIGEAIKLIPEEVKECEGAADIVKDFERIAAEFANPVELVIHVGIEVFWHGREIYGDIKQCIEDFETQKYEPAGERIGDIIYDLFLRLPQSIDDDAKDFLEGFFQGALEAESVDINNCIEDADLIIKELETIVEDFKSGITDNMEKFFLDLVDLLSLIPKSVLKCESAPPEIEKIAGWIEQLGNFDTMKYKLFQAMLFYSSRIKQDFTKVFDGYNTHQFNMTGNGLGDVLYILFQKCSYEVANPADDGVAFIRGFYFKAFNIILGLDECKNSMTDATNHIIHAMTDIFSLDVSRAYRGVIELVDVFTHFQDNFQKCAADWPMIKQGVDKMHLFIEHASGIPWALTKVFTWHSWRVTSDMYSFVSALTKEVKDFKLAGESSGDIIGLVLTNLNSTMTEASQFIKA